MAISLETAKEHEDSVAVSCCRFEAGSIIEPSNLEDPVIIPDLVDSGLLSIGEAALTIGEVLGKKLKKTVDALTPLTEEYVEGVERKVFDDKKEKKDEKEELGLPQGTFTGGTGNAIKIHIGQGKDIQLEIPVYGGFQGLAPSLETSDSHEGKKDRLSKDKVIRSLKKRYFNIDKVEFGDETKIEGSTLYIRRGIEKEAVSKEDLVVDLKIDIVSADDYSRHSQTIMDVQPIATKEEGSLGEGITRVLDGVVMVLTGTDETGVQIGEFGSSEGELDRNIMFGRPGAPDKGEILILTEVTIKEHTNMERPGPLAAHKANDFIVEEIRGALKEADLSLVSREEDYEHVRRPGNKKLVIVKEIMGQGAMHDNLILPLEPVGVLGGKPNVDLGNLPIALSPLEVLDGGIHALTCIGPASKETSRHYFREPLVLRAMKDENFDLAGVILVGSPQINQEKFYVSNRLGMMVEMMDVDGAIISTEGFGNNHIDFAAHHESIGKRGVKVVGMTYSAKQGALVVGNKYMKYMIDNNKSKQGIENEILCNNTLTDEDAIRALAMMNAVLEGEEVLEAERKWTPDVKANNIKLIEEDTGEKIDLVDNEQVLEKSKKRREIYEKE